MLGDHERKTWRELERQFMADDPEFPRSFDARAQRLGCKHLGGSATAGRAYPAAPHAAAVAHAVAER